MKQEKTFVVTRNAETGELSRSLNIKLNENKPKFNLSILVISIVILFGFIVCGFVPLPVYSTSYYSYSDLGFPVYDFTTPIVGVFDVISGVGETALSLLNSNHIVGEPFQLYLFTYNVSYGGSIVGNSYMLVYGSRIKDLTQFYNNNFSFMIFAYDDSVDPNHNIAGLISMGYVSYWGYTRGIINPTPVYTCFNTCDLRSTGYTFAENTVAGETITYSYHSLNDYSSSSYIFDSIVPFEMSELYNYDWVYM